MAVQVAEEDFKRRARRRLVGAVALTILAVIILPLVLDKEPPPAGPLNIQMPAAPQEKPAAAESPGVAAQVTKPAEQPASPEPVSPPAGLNPPMAKAVAKDSEAEPASRKAEASSKTPATEKPGQKASKGEYSVQVGAFADAANASRIKSRIQSLGLPVYTDRLGNATRVRVGPFKDKAGAEKAAVKLAAAGLPVKLESP